MARKPTVKTNKRVVPMIYAYTTPGVVYHEGWLKIGYTEKCSVHDRIDQQNHTAGIRWELAWQDNAMYKDGTGEYFKDRDFHRYLVAKKVERESGTEWFHIAGDVARSHFFNFASRKERTGTPEHMTYELRKEQEEAVEKTKAYFEQGGTEFLWNAKPRFGKTLTAYDLICRMGFQNVLIVTNRPSIANSWFEDFQRFIGWQGKYAFVSETEALKGKKGVVSRQKYVQDNASRTQDSREGMIAFESLQNLKGSIYFGGNYTKLGWMVKEYIDAYGRKKHGLCFDLLIVDEAQEGVETMKTEQAFANIQHKYTLYLSGTPFKQLASEQFTSEQIFNWTYADEQEKKERWYMEREAQNPYEALPRLTMFTYQLSPMIYDTVKQGVRISIEKGEDTETETVDFAFDLNEFFATKGNGEFEHEPEIRKFLHALTTNEKYPFSTPELRKELSHTLWLLNRVASAKALAKLLKDDEFKDIFGEYEIVLAAGDGRVDENAVSEAAYNRVKEAIKNHEKTITLSVGQLTVGVTIPEWSGILMLCNMQSASSYIQAAFRVQNPHESIKDGELYRKETAYVFDFDPARTLIIFDEYANNLTPQTLDGRGTSEDRKENIKRLLNFFPVLGEDEEGEMVELDANAVMTIPRRIKSQEVVNRGFMSNFLFQNISNIFGAPSVITDIISHLTPAAKDTQRRESSSVNLNDLPTINLDEKGEVVPQEETIWQKTQDLFGKKVYEIQDNVREQIKESMDSLAMPISISTEEADTEMGGTLPLSPQPSVKFTPAQETTQHIENIAKALSDNIIQGVIAPAAQEYQATSREQKQLAQDIRTDVANRLEKANNEYAQKERIAQVHYEERLQSATSQAEVEDANAVLVSTITEAKNALVNSIDQTIQEVVEKKTQEVVTELERKKEEKEKASVEDTIRAHLRGFSRTIPSFIMAYGDGELTLANFDTYTEPEVFQEVTGITLDDFRFLRDGGEYTEEETGETKHFAGHLFDEVVFNDSVNEFWKKKQELANYFEESHDMDIFDYIPPQKTNQIFTPKWVVQLMVDKLEENNPGCFDNPSHTFADLYMKSGLYITEIVKRLFNSDGMKKAFPDEKERLKHIFKNQVFGMAPTRIIYLIATNYILGFDEQLKSEGANFVQADTVEAAKKGTLSELIDHHFGKDR